MHRTSIFWHFLTCRSTKACSALSIAFAAFFLSACGGGQSSESGSTPSTGNSSLTGNATPPDNSQATGSTGCGKPAQFASGKYTLVSDGTTREFWVDVPSNYDANVPHPLVVGLHWRGGSATDIYTGSGGLGAFYGLKQLYGNAAIFVAPNGLDQGWANYNDRDIHFMRSMVEQLGQGLCVDSKHIYATGFSFGGMMSNAIGCQMGDVFRAVAPIAGSLWSGCADSPNRVAAIFFHSKADGTVPYQAGEEARAKFLAKNGCGSSTASIGANGCVEYQGCAAGYPVVWCGFDGGGHWPPGFSAAETKTFFDRF